MNNKRIKSLLRMCNSLAEQYQYRAILSKDRIKEAKNRNKARVFREMANRIEILT